MNEHLAVVFTTMLPAIDDSTIKYWVYGGVGVAAVAGKFLRENRDVDIYVRQEDFNRAKGVLSQLCGQHDSWSIKEPDKPLKNGRPKFEVFAGKSELLSVVPVYGTEQGVEFRASKLVILPGTEALTRVQRMVEHYRFDSPPTSVLKSILASLLTQRPELLDPHRKDQRRRVDADSLFTADELAAITRDSRTR